MSASSGNLAQAAAGSAAPAAEQRRAFLVALAVVSLLPLVTLTGASVVELPGLDRFNFGLAFVATGFHVALTSFFYVEPELAGLRREHPVRFFWAPLALCAGTAAALASTPAALPWVVSAYFSWQLYHFQRQNVGVLAMVSNCQRVARLTSMERTSVELAAFAGIAGYLALDHIPAGLLGARAGDVLAVALSAQVLAVLLSLAAWAVRARTEGWSWFGPWHLLCSAFFAGSFLIDDFGIAFGTYAYAHGLQYVVFLYLLSLSRGRSDRRLSPPVLTALGLAVALLLVLLANRTYFRWSRDAVYGVYLGLVMSHFVVDALVWRLREPTQRSYMRRAYSFVWD